MTEFYIIKLITRDGRRGFVSLVGKEIRLYEKFHTDVSQFSSNGEAVTFIRQHKLERQGSKTVIYSSKEIMEKKAEFGNVRPMQENEIVYYIEGPDGAKCYYNSELEQYEFRPGKSLGYPFWTEKEDAETLRDKFIAAGQPCSVVTFSTKKQNSPDPALKGKFMGNCNRTDCQQPGATYFNHSTMQYYCQDCAIKINEMNRADAIRIYGHELCTNGRPEDKPSK